MLLSFCAALPLGVMVALLILADEPMATVYLVLAGAAAVALFALIYGLDILTRCLAQVDGASGK